MNWQPHTRRPHHDGITAIVATVCQFEGDIYLSPCIYRWSEKHGCWMAEATGLKLRNEVFWWLPETELLEALPCPTN